MNIKINQKFPYSNYSWNGKGKELFLKKKKETKYFVDPCKLPKVSGPCSGKHKRYFFNSATNRCERFEYGGCLGNTNNFLHLADCEAKCLSSGKRE